MTLYQEKYIFTNNCDRLIVFGRHYTRLGSADDPGQAFTLDIWKGLCKCVYV